MSNPLPVLSVSDDRRTRNPDMTLRTAVLERAVRDLKEDPFIRREAIKWFRSKRLVRRYSFTYLQIIEDLNLGFIETKYIEKLVSIAEKVWNPKLEMKTVRREILRGKLSQNIIS